MLKHAADMPRAARLGTPGLLHQGMIKGIKRRRIFNDDQDRENVSERLSAPPRDRELHIEG